MVLGAVSLDSQASLSIVRSTFTAQWYVEDILKPVLLPFFLQYPGFIFQQDNARAHAARIAMNCLTACKTFSWPATVRQISLPSAHAWDIMGGQEHLPGNVDGLACQLEKIWQKIP